MRAFFLVAVLCVPSLVSAQEVFGVGARASALAGSTSARPGSADAVYYGPASLPGPDDEPGFAELELGFVFAQPQLNVSPTDPERGIEVAPTGDVRGLLLSARFDLGLPFKVEGLAFGISLYLPAGDIFRWRLRPDDTPQWLTWTDRTQHISIFAGLGFRVTDWLSLGLGAQVLFDVQTFTTARVRGIESTTDPETGEPIVDVNAQLGTEVTVFGRAAPTASMLLTPMPWMRFSVAYRGEIFVDDYGFTRLDGTPGLGAIGFVHRFSHFYQPHQLTLASSIDIDTGPGDDALTLSLDVTFNRWSRGRTPNARELGAGRYGDTWVPSLGVSWRALSSLELLLGYRYERSPFTNASGPTNLLETDRHTASIGAELDLGKFTSAFPLRLRVAYQAIVLPERTEEKDWRRFSSDLLLEGNAGFPGYAYRGWVPALWVSLGATW